MKTLLYLFLLLTAQTVVSQSVVETKYPNGLIQTRYHIQQKDTVLIEQFYPNGKIAVRNWRNDSSHLYHIGERNRFVKEYGSKKFIDWIQPYCHGFSWFLLNRDSTVEYYPDGKIHKQSFWKGDSSFQYNVFLTNGTLSESTVWEKIAPAQFKECHTWENKTFCFFNDTLTNNEQTTGFYNGKKFIQETYNHIGFSRDLVEQIYFDTLTGKTLYHWKKEGMDFYPDKDNALCLYGFRGKDDNWVIPPKYDYINNLNKLYYIVSEKGKYGILNQSGQIVLPMEWDLLEPLGFNRIFEPRDRSDFIHAIRQTPLPSTTYLRCRKGNKYGVIDNRGNIVLKVDYQDVGVKHNNLYEVKIGQNWGVVDEKGQIVVAPNYWGIQFTPEDDLFITLQDIAPKVAPNLDIETFPNFEEYRHWEFEISEYGDTISIMPRFQDKKQGLIHRNGKILLNSAFSYIKIPRPKERHFWVHALGSNHRGLFHAERGWILDTLAHQETYPNAYALTTNGQQAKEKKLGLTTLPDGKKLLPTDYQSITTFYRKIYDPQSPSKEPYIRNTYFICQKQNIWGIYDLSKQNWAIPLKYDDLKVLSDSVFLVLTGNQWRFIDLQERFLLPNAYESAGGVSFSTPPQQKFDLYQHEWLENAPYFVQRGDKLEFYSQISFPFTISLSTSHLNAFNQYESKPLKPGKLLTCHDFRGNTLFANAKGQLLFTEQNTILAQDSNLVLVENKVTKQRQLIDNQGIKKHFPSQYKILSLQNQWNTILVKDTITQKIGVLNLEGKVILPCAYFGVMLRDTQGVLWAKKDVPNKLKKRIFAKNWRKSLIDTDKNWQMFDTTGQLLSPLHFDFPFAWSNSLGIGQVAGKQGLWNRAGKSVLPAQYDKIWYDEKFQIFHLFQMESGHTQEVGFANADGKVIVEHLKNISSFTGDYALVQTHTGDYGLIQRDGQYLIPPKPYSLQQSSFDIIEFLLNIRNSSLTKHLKSRDNGSLFQAPYFNTRNNWSSEIARLDSTQRRKLHNLMLEQIVDRYFLEGEPLELMRNEVGFFSDASWGELPYSQMENLDSDHTVEHFVVNTKGIGLLLGKLSKNYQQIFKTHNFKLENNIWKEAPLESILFLTEPNKTALNALLIQKVNALKNKEIHCGDPSAYFKTVENYFYIVDAGLEFYFPQYGNNGFFENSASVLLNWEELRPFLLN